MSLNNDFFNLFDSYSKQEIEEGELYTLDKGDWKIYLTYYNKFYDWDDVSKAESKIVIFKDHENIFRYEGNLDEGLRQLKNIL